MSSSFGLSVYALLYGNYHDLHRRLITSLKLYASAPFVEVTLWCNQVCDPTKDLLRTTNFSVNYCLENRPKYKAMREMFTTRPPAHPWVVWFDDDSYINKPDWFENTRQYVMSKQPQNICYFGQPWFVHHLPGQWEFIKSLPWYKGKGPEIVRNKPGITFAQGAYWALRNDVRQLLDWPPDQFGLSHNGGDTLLSEAVRQQGLPFHKFCYGVKINDAKRRGLSEAPAGSLDQTARR
jgi:hypothetical protein